MEEVRKEVAERAPLDAALLQIGAQKSCRSAAVFSRAPPTNLFTCSFRLLPSCYSL